MSSVIMTVNKAGDTDLTDKKQIIIDLDQCECENIIGGTKVVYYPPVANNASVTTPEVKTYEVDENIFELRDAACCASGLPGVSTSLP